MDDKGAIQPGMEVYGSDNVLIGTVERLVDQDGIEVDGLEYAHSAINRVEGGRIYLDMAGDDGSGLA